MRAKTEKLVVSSCGMNIPASGNRQSGKMGTGIPVVLVPRFR
jgi:hypothetical protein